MKQPIPLDKIDISTFIKCYKYDDSLCILTKDNRIATLGDNIVIPAWDDLEDNILNPTITIEKAPQLIDKIYGIYGTSGRDSITHFKRIYSSLFDDEKIIKITKYGIALTNRNRVFTTWHYELYADIIDIFIYSFYSDYQFGLKKDGTIILFGRAGSSEHEFRVKDKIDELCSWKDIKKIAVDLSHIVGLKYDGSVIALGSNNWHQCEVYNWRNVIDISCHYDFTAGLTKDGVSLFTPEFYKHLDLVDATFYSLNRKDQPIPYEANFLQSSNIYYWNFRIYGLDSIGCVQIADFISGKYFYFPKTKGSITYYFTDDSILSVTADNSVYEIELYDDSSSSCHHHQQINGINTVVSSNFGTYLLDKAGYCFKKDKYTSYSNKPITENVISIGCGENYFACITLDDTLHIDTKQKSKFEFLTVNDVETVNYMKNYIIFHKKNGDTGTTKIKKNKV